MIASPTFTTAEPCATCGAGMGHQPDHAAWCADVTLLCVAINRLTKAGGWPDWYRTGRRPTRVEFGALLRRARILPYPV